ncbi:MAG: imidazole glycerol phosphate synthase subunit HisH [Rhodothermaceae bacterium]|nr:imidazole glycerol phosphate synthase subunit HisH [Rhodothermaceae bacterium]
MIALIDYGAGNTRSVVNALDRLSVDWTLSADPAVLNSADKLILPGVGAAGSAMHALREAGLVDVLRATEQPLLGVCLGLQLLYERSEEDDTECLGLLPGVVRRFPDGGVPIPHMGWNTLRLIGETSLLDAGMDDAHAYFVHSYAAPMGPETRATCTYAGVTFSAVVQHGRVVATQFHPEKSAALGAAVLRNFVTA